MKIDRFTTRHIAIPLGRELHTAIHRIDAVNNILVEIESEGITGIGYAFTFNGNQARSIRQAIHALIEVIRDDDPRSIRQLNEKMSASQNFIGTAGVGTLARSAIDTALWDLHGKRAGMPLYRMWGGDRSSLDVYATGGWISYSTEELIEEAEAHIAAGYQNYKIKVGFQDWRQDVDRFEKLMNAVGNRMNVMVDANQAWRPDAALAAGREFQKLGASWYEEPIDALDFSGSAEIARSLDVPIATGETVFGLNGFVPLIELHAADVLMPDIMRVGGPTGFFDVANFARAHHQVVSSHTFTEVSAHVMSACPNGTLVEYIPRWWDDMFDEAPRVNNGQIHLTDAPGFGLTFAEKAMNEWSVDDVAVL